MKNARFTKLIAVATMAAMVLTPASVFADDSAEGATSGEGTIYGTGDLEDYVSKEVFRISLPTVSSTDFTIDTQGLLHVASANDYKVEKGAIYFTNAPAVSGDSSTYSSTSDPIEIINKSSFPIDVDVTVKVTPPTGLTMVEEESALDSATAPSLYLAMKEEKDESATALKSGTNEAATKTLDGVAEGEDGYVMSVSGDEYSYKLSDTFDVSKAARASYTLTGACDQAADWTALKDESVATETVWTAKKAEETDSEPKVNVTAATYDRSQDLKISISLGSRTKAVEGVTKIGYSSTETGTYTTLASDKWSQTTTYVTFNSGQFSSASSGDIRYLKIKFSDDLYGIVKLTIK